MLQFLLKENIKFYLHLVSSECEFRTLKVIHEVDCIEAWKPISEPLDNEPMHSLHFPYTLPIKGLHLLLF